jgi:hypothetical protein
MKEELGKFKSDTGVRIGVIRELFGTLWKYKLWWALPIIIIILLITIFLVIAGYSGIGVFLYPLI